LEAVWLGTRPQRLWSGSTLTRRIQTGSLNEVNPSLWVGTTSETSYPALQEEVQVDVAILGAGITGLSAALTLLRAGASVAVIEAGRIASGVTGYTTAKLTSLHGLTYASILDQHGEENARRYGEAAESAISTVAGIVEEAGIECNFERRPAYTYTADEKRVSDIEKEVEVAQSLGLPASFVTETELPFEVKAAIRFDNQAMFHPRKYCLGIAGLIAEEGGRIFELTRALDIEPGSPGTVETDRGTVRADHVIQATQLPFHDPAGLFARNAPMRSYALAIKSESPPPEGMYLGIDTPGRSIRSHREGDLAYLLVGGEGHKVGQDPDTARRYQALESWASDTFGLGTPEFRWSAQDYTPADGVPYIGKLAPGADTMWVATGFKKWGMTTGVAAGTMLTDLILNRDSPWAEAFDSTRIKLGASAKKLVQENTDVFKRFVSDHLDHSVPELQNLGIGQGDIVQAGDKKIAAYRDERDVLHAVSRSCTHLACEVSFNTAERTWDCPCHGSRFDIDGRVIQGPAVEDLKRVELEEVKGT
jgi:glycine/D-amino acid oxidase-like deaminating enzyme/nitrite reductase/ring-hydroxylating ferredoxin subunit